MHNPENRYPLHVFQVIRQSVSLCWDVLKNDVPLVDTTCTDQDEDETSTTSCAKLRKHQSDASWTSEDETQHVSSVVLAKCQLCPGLSVFHLSEKNIFLSSYPSSLCQKTFQVVDQ